MVGGIVINVVQLDWATWVQVVDRPDGTQTCAIYVAKTDVINPGDRLWWQSNIALWTSQANDAREDVKMKRLSVSHSSIPAEVLEAII